MPRTLTFFHAVLALLIAAASISAAWAFELIGGYAPCHLCLMQRDPYYYALPLLVIAITLEWMDGARWLIVLMLALVVLAFVYNGALGTYHAGAEWHFWPGPANCGATRGGDIPQNAGDLLTALNTIKIPSCTEPQIRILGLSFAGWNVLVSGVLAVVAGLACQAKLVGR